MFNLRNKEWGIFLGLILIFSLFFAYVLVRHEKSEAAIDLAPIVANLKANGWYNAVGYQSIAPNSTTASALTQSSMTSNTTIAWITCETATVRYRIDGTAPTTTQGHALAANGTLTLKGRHQIDKFRAISSAAHGTLKITYGE